MSSYATCTAYQEHQVVLLYHRNERRLLGRHCFLWCLTKRDCLKNPPNPLSLRTTESICSDNSKLRSSGAPLKNAKLFNNAIREPFFKEIPIDQVKLTQRVL